MAKRVCPFWIGYLLISPVRTLMQNPEKILNPYITSGMKVLDIGCGMGFFSLPIARMVGSNGKVVCIDVQEKMIQSLQKRAKTAGLSDMIETRICPENSLGLEDFNEDIDFAFAFAVIHEVPSVTQFFSEIYTTLKPSGMLLAAGGPPLQDIVSSHRQCESLTPTPPPVGMSGCTTQSHSCQ